MSKIGDYMIGIAEDLAKFAHDIDTYGFRDDFQDTDEAVGYFLETLADDPEVIIENLREWAEHMADEENFKDDIALCNELIAKVAPLT